MTTRTALPTNFDINPHYMFTVSHKLDAETTYNVLGQLKSIDISGSADKKEFKRVGDANATARYGSQTYDVTLAIYFDNDIEEVAALLGYRKPAGTGGWVGTESISFSPSNISDLKIEAWTGTTTAATLRTTETLADFRPGTIKFGIDSEGDARIAEITGTCDSYTIVPVAGLVS